jgi:hypothetical protein
MWLARTPTNTLDHNTNDKGVAKILKLLGHVL